MNAQTKEAAGGGTKTKAWQADPCQHSRSRGHMCAHRPDFPGSRCEKEATSLAGLLSAGREQPAAEKMCCAVSVRGVDHGRGGPVGTWGSDAAFRSTGQPAAYRVCVPVTRACWVAKRMHHCLQITVVITDKRGGSAQPSHTSVQPFLQIVRMCPSPVHAPTQEHDSDNTLGLGQVRSHPGCDAGQTVWPGPESSHFWAPRGSLQGSDEAALRAPGSGDGTENAAL